MNKVSGSQVRNGQRLTEHYGNGMCYWMEAGADDYNATKVLPATNSKSA